MLWDICRGWVAGLYAEREGVRCPWPRDDGEGSKETDVEADEEEGAPILPTTVDDERVCLRCYALDTCKIHASFIGG